MKLLRLKRKRDVGRQKSQFIAVLVAVVLGVALFAGMFNAYLNLGSSLEGSYERLVMADMTVTNADDGFVDTAMTLDGVSYAIARQQADVPFEIGSHQLLGRVIGMPTDNQPAINMVDIESGTYLDPDDPTGVLLEEHAATGFDLDVGDTFTILGEEVTVVGIAVSPEYLWPARDRQTLFTPPNTFAVAFVDETMLEALPSSLADLQVLVDYKEEVDTETVDSRVESAARAANAADIQTLEDQPSNSTINLEISGLQTMAVALPVLFLVAAGMAIYVVVTRLVYAQRGVIGTLRATGFERRVMSKHYGSFGTSVGLVGAMIGAVLGALMGRGMTAIYTTVFGIPDLVADFHLPTIIISLIFGLVAGGLAAIPPARIVADMAPAEAMRGDAPATGGKRSFLETVIPPLRRAPVRWKMTLRGMGRNKKRSTSMVVGVVLSMTMILAAAGMIDTMLGAFNRQFNEIAIEDASVVFTVPVGDDQVASVEDIFVVDLAEPVLGMRVTIESGTDSFSTLLEGYQRNTQVHGFPDGLPAEGVLVGQAMEGLLGITVGDTVTVEFSDLKVEIRTTIEGFLDEPMATVAYMEEGGLATALNEVDASITSKTLQNPSITTVKARYEPNVDPAVAISELQLVDDVAVVVDATELRQLLEDFQAFFYVFMGMALVFGGAMAFALIFNIISVNVAERANEFATMRANGLSHRKVASMITGETFLLTAIGIIPGLLVGYWAAVAFMGTFSSEQFPIQADLSIWTYILGSVALFVVAGLSLIPAVRAIKRINVGEIVRERSI